MKEQLEFDAVVKIRNNQTGESRDYKTQLWDSDYDPGVPNVFWWEEGNAKCDCNRALFFARVNGEEEPDVPCGDELYSVRIYMDGKIIYDEY